MQYKARAYKMNLSYDLINQFQKKNYKRSV